jgi:hypothetical protein
MMKMKEVINGSLYVNEKTNQIERVRSKANSQSVFTTVHNENLKIVKSKDLSIASTFQVDQYVKESEVKSGKLKNPVRRLLPAVSVG